MAIYTVALHTIAGWFAPTKQSAKSVELTSTPPLARSQHSIRVLAQDEEEAQRVRKAGQDLMKFQSINRGY